MQTSGKRSEKPGDFRSRLPECRLSWRSKECKRAESAAKSRGIFAVAPPSAASHSCDFCQPTRKSCQPSRDFCQPACSRRRFSAVCWGTIADARMLPTPHGLGRNPGEDRLRLGRIKKKASFLLLLRSPFTDFASRRQATAWPNQEESKLSLASALAFHYLCTGF